MLYRRKICLEQDLTLFIFLVLKLIYELRGSEREWSLKRFVFKAEVFECAFGWRLILNRFFLVGEVIH